MDTTISFYSALSIKSIIASADVSSTFSFSGVCGAMVLRLGRLRDLLSITSLAEDSSPGPFLSGIFFLFDAMLSSGCVESLTFNFIFEDQLKLQT